MSDDVNGGHLGSCVLFLSLTCNDVCTSGSLRRDSVRMASWRFCGMSFHATGFLLICSLEASAATAAPAGLPDVPPMTGVGSTPSGSLSMDGRGGVLRRRSELCLIARMRPCCAALHGSYILATFDVTENICILKKKRKEFRHVGSVCGFVFSRICRGRRRRIGGGGG